MMTGSLWRGRFVMLAFIVGCGVADAQVWRWVDAQGVTHYGSSPPAGANATPVQLAPPAPAPAASAARPGPVELARRLAAERERADAAQAAEQQQLQQQQRLAERRLQRCALAREQLGTVERGGPVFSVDARGQPVYLPEDRRDAEITRLRDEVGFWCDQIPAAQQDAATQTRTQQAERERQCQLARQRLAFVEAPGTRAVPQDVEDVRAQVRAWCGP